MDFAVIVEYFPRLLQGAVTTLELVLVSGIIGSLLALPIGLARHSHRWWLKAIPYGYIFFFRGTPLLVQIFLVYYGIAQFESIRESSLWPYLREPYWCAIIAFSLNTAAYTAEILRGALGAVPRGEVEAAKSIGMRKVQLYKRIMLPRALGMIMPAYGNEVILMLKGSAPASTITLLDLTGMARTIIARTYTPIEIFLAAGVIYLLMSMAIIQLFRYLEMRSNRHMEVAR
ncbi:ABC transporter permease [Oceanospirillum beijerinckii]|uniref:ABC transporter permease n=1 Tax=Oceanospirillum beijerinckii TaxID=64976 RepID=UPI00041A68E3|nr:ABC transporter permease [Oceanospirillum beijerinckii]